MRPEDWQGMEAECNEIESLLQQEWAARINLPQLCMHQDVGASLNMMPMLFEGMRSVASHISNKQGMGCPACGMQQTAAGIACVSCKVGRHNVS